MTNYVSPTLISERENDPHRWPDGRVDPEGAEDCLPASFLMAINGLHADLVPASLTEAERLRMEAGYGPTGPTAIEPDPVTHTIGILAAAQKLYGLGAVRVLGPDFATLWANLAEGHAAVVIGRPSNLVYDSVIRLYLPAFTGLHAVYVQRRNYLLRVAYFDPMAPQASKPTSISKAELKSFYVGSAAIFSIAKAA